MSSIKLEYSIKASGSLLKFIPTFSLLSINNLYIGSSKSLAYEYILSTILGSL